MIDFPETDYSLIDRVRDADDTASWLEFVGLYQPIVYRMARRRGMQDADAQDVMQQVFVAIARSVNGWDASSARPPFRAWLTTIARNAISTALTRRPKDQSTGSTSVAELLQSEPDASQTESEVAAELQMEIVRWAADQIRAEFSKKTWDIFWETSMNGVSAAEMAQRTSRSLGAIYVARHRVLSRLKEKINEVSEHWKCP